MALSSPGVEVNIIDQSQYLPAASSSVPLLIVATAQNKANATSTTGAVAAGTLQANANKLYQVSSQKDILTLFGSPFFYKTSNGTPIQGYELNEYGLLAAYSLMGVTNGCYILRADVDLGTLVGTLNRPVGQPAAGSYWLNTTSSAWGIFEFNATTGSFNAVTPIVITDTAYIDTNTGYPMQSVGSIGSYAVLPDQITSGKAYNAGTYFYKTYTNTWELLGSQGWKAGIPTLTCSASNPALTSGSFTINVNGQVTRTITISGSDSVTSVAGYINGLSIGDLSARVDGSGRLVISLSSGRSNAHITLTDVSNTPSSQLGFVSGQYYYGADTVFAPSSGMPLWTTSQATPHPTGSVWIKTSASGSGLDTVLSQYSSSSESFTSIAVNTFDTLNTALPGLDLTGGQSIPAGTVVQITGDTTIGPAGLLYYVRNATGPTVSIGTQTAFSVSAPGKSLNVVVTTPGVNTFAQYYTVALTGKSSGSYSAEDFVIAWQAANIPNTAASLGAAGEVILTHTLGGDIILSDIGSTGISNGFINELGYTFGTNSVPQVQSYTNNAPTHTNSTSGGATSATFVITNNGSYYSYTLVSGTASGGHSYQVGDLLTFNGSELGGVNTVNDLVLSVQTVSGDNITSVAYYSGTPKPNYATRLSNWSELYFTASLGAPATAPADGTTWFYSTASQVDIMVNKNGVWKGYGNVAFDSNGHPAVSGSTGQTNPSGIIVSTVAPVTQLNGNSLVWGDLWLDSSDLENYPMISRWQAVNGTNQWVSIDNTDQTSHSGILFADARWGIDGSVNPISDPYASIASLWTSDYLDLDAPDATLYPQGMLLFNTRRSGYNVKKFVTNYFTNSNFSGAGSFDAGSPATIGNLPQYSYTWVSASGLKDDGSAYMGRKAQRVMIVKALKTAINTNMSIREEDTFFNLIACPGYPELQPDMVTLNNDRNNTAYVLGDTPMRLPDDETAITNWATNAMTVAGTGEDGLVTRDEYMGIFYPSGLTTDLTGASVVVPASHMMLRTFLQNDAVSYPWLAAAGTRRGTITNATAIGYIDAATGEFISIKNRQTVRDALYTNQINPLAYFSGVGLLNYGNKSSYESNTSLDRTNVGRLVAYIRYKLQTATRPFVFEPNDALTRSQVAGVVQSLFVDLVGKRGLYDYIVVCDETNNTPARIDANELWIDVAIEPVKAAEFIYIPVRIVNTGGIAALATA